MSIHLRETSFHDDWAKSVATDNVRVRECFEAPTSMENRFILERMGPLLNKRVLDIGTGLGESAVYFALQGAQVTAVDISSEMVQKAISVGSLHGVQITGIVCEGEDLCLPQGEFDLIYTANTIHHVTDRSQFFQQIYRALKPGGQFFSFDPIAYNPVINIYRKLATHVRTIDETPLTQKDLKLAQTIFANVGHREFWVATLFLFIKYYIIDGIHPNHDRYWKRILTETNKSLWWWTPLRSIDKILTRIPGLRWLSWNMVMWGEKPTTNAS